jgi:hypothetical protein
MVPACSRIPFKLIYGMEFNEGTIPKHKGNVFRVKKVRGIVEDPKNGQWGVEGGGIGIA